MRALADLKELASSGRAMWSTPSREAEIERSSAEHVDEQIAHLLETIEADTPTRHVLERDEAADERPPAPAGSRKQPRLVVSSGPTVSARLLSRFPWRWHPARSDVAFILLGAAAGVLLGTLLGR